MSRIFAIGDIHGCVRTFYNLMDKIQIQKSDTIYLIGDYIDRGPDSKGVIDLILELRQKDYSIRTLRGNHEQMMMDSAKSKHAFNQWFDNGGEAILKSFGVNSYNELNPVYKQFFPRTRFILKTDLTSLCTQASILHLIISSKTGIRYYGSEILRLKKETRRSENSTWSYPHHHR